MKIGTYVRVNSPGSKNHGLDGRVTKELYDWCVSVKMLHNGKHIRIKRHNLIVHATLIYQRKSDGMLGRMPGDMSSFTPNIGDEVIRPARASAFVPFFFKNGMRVRIMSNSVGYVGTVIAVSPNQGVVNVEFVDNSNQTQRTWRNMKELILAKETDIASVMTKVVQANTVYELTLITKKGDVKKTDFHSIEQMKSYLNALVSPDLMSEMYYRTVRREFGEKKPITVKTVTTFEV